MVSHPVVVAANSPIVAPAPPPISTTLPTILPLSMPSPASTKSLEQSKLHKLFKLGEKRFDVTSDEDEVQADMFADIYVRTLQIALRGSAIRNQRLAKELKAIRSTNANIRATKCEQRVAAERRAAAAKQQA